MSVVTRVAGGFRTRVIPRQAPIKTFARSLSSQPIAVNVSSEEVTQGRLTGKNLELATRAIHRDGLVVLENVIEHNRLDELNAKMLEDARTLQNAGDDSPYNYNKG